ncbi:hypothetical protein YC2023_112236 [Brassica napus]
MVCEIPNNNKLITNGFLFFGLKIGSLNWQRLRVVIDGPSRASCHRHTFDSDQTSYLGMVARTICEDSVRNHRSKLPWIKHQSTNWQGQVAIYIIMNVSPWTNLHNRITTVGMSSRYYCDPRVGGIVESAHRSRLVGLPLPPRS